VALTDGTKFFKIFVVVLRGNSERLTEFFLADITHIETRINVIQLAARAFFVSDFRHNKFSSFQYSTIIHRMTLILFILPQTNRNRLFFVQYARVSSRFGNTFAANVKTAVIIYAISGIVNYI